MPSIVAITNKSVEEVEGWFRGQVFQYESESAGSGIIVGQNDDELLICTNNHVVEDAHGTDRYLHRRGILSGPGKGYGSVQ